MEVDPPAAMDGRRMRTLRESYRKALTTIGNSFSYEVHSRAI